MPDLNPIHWLLVGCVILLLGSLGYAGVTKMQLRASEGQFRGFVAETEAKASIQALENWKESAKRDKITQELELKNVEAKNDRDRKYSEYRRMLNSSTRSSGESALSDQTKERICRQDEKTITEAMGRLEGGILDILQQGQAGIDAAIVYEDWIDQQTKVQ